MSRPANAQTLLMPTCHPDRPYVARGLCSRCYTQEPDIRDKARQRYRTHRTAGRVYQPQADRYRPWTPAEDDQVRAYYADRRTTPLELATFARQLDRSRVAVSLRASRLGLGHPTRPKVLQRKRRRHYATKEERAAAMAPRRKEWLRTHPHPRGMLGRQHTAEARARMSARIRAAWRNPASRLRTPEAAQRRSDQMLARVLTGTMRSGYTRSRGGRRADLGNLYFRSRWEANYARYLTMRQQHGEIAEWQYEAKTFVFEKITRGTRAYTPDFKVIYPDGHYEWHEVKGWMDSPSRTRLSRMKRYFPNEPIILVDKAWFDRIRRVGLAGAIPGWERG